MAHASSQPFRLSLLDVQSGEPTHVPCAMSVPAWVGAVAPELVVRERVRLAGVLHEATLEVSRGANATLVSATLTDAGTADANSFQAAASSVLAMVFDRLAQSAHPHAVRVWCFLPHIYGVLDNGLDRYVNFNIARHGAFVQLFGADAVQQGALPTSSCVGHAHASLCVHVLSTSAGGHPVENARQVPAFAYSNRYGPRPPCFARATRCRIGNEELLLVGGTASVRGEESVHAGSLELQLEEALTNVGALLTSAASSASHEILATRVYAKREEHRLHLEHALPREFSIRAPLEVVRADICRDELLVEIELLVRLGDSVGEFFGERREA